MRQRTTNMTSQPRAAPRRSTTAVAGKRPPAPERLSDERFGEEEALALALAMNERAPLVIRVNTLRAQPEIVRSRPSSFSWVEK